MPITTVTEMFLAGVKHDKPDCFLYKKDGEYHPRSTAEFYDNVRRLASALHARGIGVKHNLRRAVGWAVELRRDVLGLD